MITKDNMRIEEKSTNQLCNHCGDGVYLGSGKFVDRIPDFNDVDARISNGLLFSLGDFVCEQCDNNL